MLHNIIDHHNQLGDQSSVNASVNNNDNNVGDQGDCCNNNNSNNNGSAGTPLRMSGSGHQQVCKDAASSSALRTAAGGIVGPFKTPQTTLRATAQSQFLQQQQTTTVPTQRRPAVVGDYFHQSQNPQQQQQQQPATIGRYVLAANHHNAVNTSFSTPAKNLFGDSQQQQQMHQETPAHNIGGGVSRLRGGVASSRTVKAHQQQYHQVNNNNNSMVVTRQQQMQMQQQLQQYQQHLEHEQHQKRLVALIDGYRFPAHRQPRPRHPMHRTPLLRNSQFQTFGDRAPILTVVLDLDETLVNNRLPNASAALLRPHVHHFLEYIRSLGPGLELVLWTASTSDTAGPVVRQLSAGSMSSGGVCPFDEVVFRSPEWFSAPFHTKDLRLLGRDMRRVCVVDNAANCVKYNPCHAILVDDFVQQRPAEDETLICLGRIIAGLYESLRGGIGRESDEEQQDGGEDGTCVPSALRRLAQEGELCFHQELHLNEDWAKLESMSHIDPIMIPPHGHYVRARNLHPRTTININNTQSKSSNANVTAAKHHDAVSLAMQQEQSQPQHRPHRFRIVSSNLPQQAAQLQAPEHHTNNDNTNNQDENDSRANKQQRHQQFQTLQQSHVVML